MSALDDVKKILCSVLQLPNSTTAMVMESPLLGALPEFDSMAVVSIIEALENQFGFTVDDDEINADVFETVGTLVAFVEDKLNAG